MSDRVFGALVVLIIGGVLFKVYVIDAHPWILWLLVSLGALAVLVKVFPYVYEGYTSFRDALSDDWEADDPEMRAAVEREKADILRMIDSVSSESAESPYTETATAVADLPGKRRKRRPKIPKPVEREVYARAGDGCQFPGCEEMENTEIHHIDGNRDNNDVNNLIVLCKRHHAKADHGQYKRVSLEAWNKQHCASSRERFQ